MISASQLYSYLTDDPLIDFLELRYSYLKKIPAAEEYDLDLLQKTQRQQSRTSSLQSAIDFLDHHDIHIPASMIHTYHFLKQKTLFAVQFPSLRSTRFYANPDFVLSKAAYHLLNIECPSDYACLFIDSTKSPYTIAKWYLAKKVLDHITEQDTSIYLYSNQSVRKITFTEEQLNIVEEAIDWIRDLKHNSETWSIESKSYPDVRLLPNLSRKTPAWDHVKEDLADKWGELTQICHIGNQTRKLFHRSGIYSIHQSTPFLSFLQQLDIDPICKLIGDKLVSEPHSSFCKSTPLRPSLESFTQTILSVDMESYADTWHDKQPAGEVMIGCLVCRPGHPEQYHVFYNRDSTKVKDEFGSFLSLYKDPLIIHYTDADKSVIPSQYRTLDVHPLLRIYYQTYPEVRAYRFLKFGLKHICSKLFGNLYQSCTIQNGCEASAALYHADRIGIHTPKGSMLQQQVTDYNRIDVYALAYLYSWLLSIKKKD
jgi:hypothetical protein